MVTFLDGHYLIIWFLHSGRQIEVTLHYNAHQHLSARRKVSFYAQTTSDAGTAAGKRTWGF